MGRGSEYVLFQRIYINDQQVQLIWQRRQNYEIEERQSLINGAEQTGQLYIKKLN